MTLAEGLFRPFPFRNILTDNKHNQCPIHALHRACRLFHPEQAAIFPEFAQAPMENYTRVCDALLNELLGCHFVLDMKDAEHSLASQFSHRIPKMFSAKPIDRQHCTRSVQGKVHRRIIFIEDAVALLTLFQGGIGLLARGNVTGDRDQILTIQKNVVGRDFNRKEGAIFPAM